MHRILSQVTLSIANQAAVLVLIEYFHYTKEIFRYSQYNFSSSHLAAKMDAYVTFVCVVVVFVGVLSMPIRGEARSDPIIFDFRFDHKLIPPAPTMMQSTLVVDMMGCLGSCVNSQWCKVGNLKIKPEKNGLYLCEVFSTDAYNKNNKLTVNKVFRHFRIRVSEHNTAAF